MTSPQIHLRIDPSLKERYYNALTANGTKATYHLMNEIIKYTEAYEKKKKAEAKEKATNDSDHPAVSKP